MTKERRPHRMSYDTKLRVAQDYQVPILMADFPLTLRMQRHVIYGPDGQPLAQFKLITEAMGNLVINGVRQFLLDSIDYPRPFYMTIADNRRMAKWQK